MARGSNRNRSVRNETSSLPSLKPLLSPPSINTLIRIDPPHDLRQIEDRRTFYPARPRPAASVRSPRHRLQIPWNINRSRWPLSIPTGVQFVDAKNVMVCVRRRIRREVLFAVKRGAIGLGRKHSWPWQKRKRRRNSNSSVSC